MPPIFSNLFENRLTLVTKVMYFWRGVRTHPTHLACLFATGNWIWLQRT